MTITLPFTPRAQPGESPLSLLRRAAHGNGMRSTLRFFYSFNPRLDHSATAFGTLARNPQLFRYTSLAAGIPADDVEAVIYRRAGAGGRDALIWNGLQVPVGALSFRQAKTCVACLLDQGYSSSEWDHRAASACAEHQVLLGSECPVCHVPWTHDEGLLACDCAPGQMRERLVPVDAPASSLLSRLIERRDQGGLMLLTLVERVLAWWSTLGVVLSPLGRAMALSDLHNAHWTAPPPSSAGSELLHPRVALGPLLIDPLPEARSLARQLLQQSAPAMEASSLDHPVSAREAMAILGVERVPFAKLVRDGHLGNHSDGVPVSTLNRLLWSVSGTTPEAAGLVPLSQLCGGSRRTSLSSALTAIQAERIIAFHCPVETGLQGLQLMPEPKTLQPNSSTLLGLPAVATQLGVHPDYVRGVQRAGLLEGIRGSAHSAVQWQFQPEAVERFDTTYVFASAIAKVNGYAATTFSSRLRSAGLMPVSGPGIDRGLTFVFRRADMAHLDLYEVATAGYVSPAGRKLRPAVEAPDSYDWGMTATALGVPSRDLRGVIDDGWIQPLVKTSIERRFCIADVTALKSRIAEEFVEVVVAATELGQSIAQFRRSWIGTGLVPIRRFGNRELLSITDFDKIRPLWNRYATGAEIGRRIGRDRAVCSNLEKIDQLNPATVLGTGSRKVKLYARDEAVFERFLPENLEIALSP